MAAIERRPRAPMHLERHGSGAPLILLHGWAMHGGVFASLIERLAESFQVHVIDLPGHGASVQPVGPLDLQQIAIQIAEEIPHAVVLGWSLGGLLALHAALLRPQLVRALVLVAASPRFVMDADWPHALKAQVFDEFGRDLRRDWRGTVARFLALECQGSQRARAELRCLRSQVFARGEPAVRVLEDGLRILADTDLRCALPRVQCPALWIAGANDRLLPWQAMQHAAAVMPQGQFVRIDGGGHAPFIGYPDQVLDAIANWREKHSLS